MPDPITGIETELPGTQDVLDYLGRQAPLSFSGQAALPGVAAPAPSTGPAGPSGLGQGPGAMADSSSVVPSDAGGAAGGGVADELALTRQAIGAAQAGRRGYENLFGGAPGGFQASFPSGLSLSGPEATGAQFPIEQLSLTGRGDAGTNLPSEGFSLSGGEAADAGVGAGAGVSGLVGAGLSSAGLMALIASIAESQKITPAQAVALLQSGGGTAAGLASTLGPEGGTALAGTLGPEAAGLLGAAGTGLGVAGGVAGTGYSLYRAIDAIQRAQEDPRAYSTAIGAGTGLGVGAAVGSLAGPYGALVGAGVGGVAGTALGDVVAANLPKPHSIAVRQHWGEVATDAVNNYGFGIQKAASNGEIAPIQQALAQAGADGHVSARLTLPPGIASALGVAPGANFADMNEGQFLQLLKAYTERDATNVQGWVQGTGDVPYLDQDRAQQVAESMTETAKATMTILGNHFDPILRELPPVDPEGLANEWAQKWGPQGAPPEILQYVQSRPGYEGVLARASVLGPQVAAQRAQEEARSMQELKDLYVSLYGTAQLEPQTPEARDLYGQIWGPGGAG